MIGSCVYCVFEDLAYLNKDFISQLLLLAD